MLTLHMLMASFCRRLDESHLERGFGESLAEPRDGRRQDALVGGRQAVVSLSLCLEESAVGVNRTQMGSPKRYL